jgi:hypothetical protein
VTGDLVLFAGLVLVIGVAGGAIGILLIAPRLDRWIQGNDDEADDRRD